MRGGLCHDRAVLVSGRHHATLRGRRYPRRLSLPCSSIFRWSSSCRKRKGLPFMELDTAFLWASALMLLSSFAAYLIMKRIGILR
jgi:hypothetical protein